MSQDEVLNFFKKNPNRWINCKEIGEHLGVRLNVINTGVRKLTRFKYLESRPTFRKNMCEFRYIPK